MHDHKDTKPDIAAHTTFARAQQYDPEFAEALIDTYSRPEPIIAELYGDDVAATADVSVTSPKPVLELARRLVDLGVDPATPLHVFRNGALALIVRSIGEAAQLEINGHGNGFRRRHDGGTAPPMQKNGSEDTEVAAAAIGGSP